MMRSLFSAVSGLRNHQVQMDVIGNNIANVNTVAFKSSRCLFQDMLSQTLKAAGGPTEGRGGTNPQQVGLGMRISSIDNIFTQGNLMSTQNKTDLAIEGDGFFILSDGESTFYTRAGNFKFDIEGNLVNPSNGYIVQGYMADEEGFLGKTLQNIQIDFSQRLPAKPTDEVSFVGNLNSDAEPTYAASNTLLTKLFDEDGNPMNLHIGDTISFSGTVDTTNINGSLKVEETTNLSDLAYALQAAIRAAGDGTETVTVQSDGSLQVTAGSFDITGLTMTCTGNTEFNSYGDIGDIPAEGTGSTPEGSRAPDYTTFVTAYDSLGKPQIITLYFAKDTSGVSNTWHWLATVPYKEGSPPSGDTGTLTFNSDGSLATGDQQQLTFDPDGANEGADEMRVNLRFGTKNKFDGLTQFAALFSATVKEQNGYPSGTLDDISIDEAGIVTGIFTNGVNRTLAQIPIAIFSNQDGLYKKGDNLYQQSLNSGIAQVGQAGTGGRGSIVPSTLEMSNVDLAQSFTEIIVAQRGFQVNARVITASDQILQELVNLKR
ncbi:flagellar hook protein FlgE [Candidatus Aerophobetes bacterium]|uniref:Flagellar hook protein FlgE n=1 Tax=Aerophobetes bacterium TaxID=2030807 RepID=A0A497E3C9_UNCAE|nr:MAG: flagellar hook protein FlgE [Candidatus Aerophobetes bacterium]